MVTVFDQQFDSPLYSVLDSLSGRVFDCPKFKIFRTIVGADAIFVMNALFRVKRSAKNLLHYRSMLRDSSDQFVTGVMNVTGALEIVRTLVIAEATAVVTFAATINYLSAALVFLAAIFALKYRCFAHTGTGVSFPFLPLFLSRTTARTESRNIWVFSPKKFFTAVFASIFGHLIILLMGFHTTTGDDCQTKSGSRERMG